MVKSLQLMVIFLFMGVLVTSFPIQGALAASGFTNTYETTGVIMKFCSNHAITLQECEEKYEGYTWTDRVNVLIYAPGWNEDEDKIEKIGESLGTPITISTRDSSVDTAIFTETGPDTGVFFGVVKLTGQHYTVHDQNDIDIKAHGHLSSNYGELVSDNCQSSSSGGGGHGHGFLIPLVMKMKGLLFSAIMMDFIPEAHASMGGHMMHHKPDCGFGITGSAMDVAARLPTDFQEGAVTVSWEPNDDVVITKTATWTWRVGEISFEKDQFSTNEPIKFTLHDADLWIHHAEFFTYWMRVYSDSDQGGILVPVQFIQNHDHGSEVEFEGVTTQLSEPAAASLTKYTPDGKWKLYFWWEPGGVIGVDQEYDLNLMVHDGMTDLHQMKLDYDMEIWFNGELVDARIGQFAGDGHAVEPVKFNERGSVKIVFNNLFGTDEGEDFSFQVAPEAVIEENVPRHHAFSALEPEKQERVHTHFIDVLEGEFYVTLDEESQELDKLKVGSGDTITVEYIDMTLPKPYVTSDDIDIIAKTVVYDQPIGLVNVDELTEESSTIKEVSADSPSYEGIKRIQDAKTQSPITSVAADISIPTWVKKNASWWSDGQINDPEFAKGIEYLIQENVIDVPVQEVDIEEQEANITSIPMWVRNNADWWSSGHLTDVEFANGIKFLISTGLIKV